jgi:hypothetical protein
MYTHIYLHTPSSGEYTVNGVRYLQGSKHEDELRAGAQCEIFNEVWYRHAYPHTYICAYFHMSANNAQPPLSH